MHVSTAFNFSKKLEERGLLSFSKRDTDKRNTYVDVTPKGKTLLEEMYHNYHDTPHSVIEGSIPMKELYGKFPEFMDVMAVIRNIYGDDFNVHFLVKQLHYALTLMHFQYKMKRMSHTNQQLPE